MITQLLYPIMILNSRVVVGPYVVSPSSDRKAYSISLITLSGVQVFGKKLLTFVSQMPASHISTSASYGSSKSAFSGKIVVSSTVRSAKSRPSCLK